MENKIGLCDLFKKEKYPNLDKYLKEYGVDGVVKILTNWGPIHNRSWQDWFSSHSFHDMIKQLDLKELKEHLYIANHYDIQGMVLAKDIEMIKKRTMIDLSLDSNYDYEFFHLFTNVLSKSTNVYDCLAGSKPFLYLSLGVIPSNELAQTARVTHIIKRAYEHIEKGCEHCGDGDVIFCSGDGISIGDRTFNLDGQEFVTK